MKHRRRDKWDAEVGQTSSEGVARRNVLRRCVDSGVCAKVCLRLRPPEGCRRYRMGWLAGVVRRVRAVGMWPDVCTGVFE